MKRTDAIIVLDGYGLSGQKEGNAVRKAATPYLDFLFKSYPNCALSASGVDVGLPKNQMGNSEVGHLNIGGGRIVYQDIMRISNAIDDGTFSENPALKIAMLNGQSSAVHLMGLISDGGVHSTLTHLYALIKMAKDNGVKDIFIHCITDGRDTPPSSAIEYLTQIESQIKQIGAGKIATVSGRYFAMDRGNNWERVQRGYECIFEADAEIFDSAIEAVEHFYKDGVTDEFLPPIVVGDYKGFNRGDSLVFFNFRADRARQISRAATEVIFKNFVRKDGYKEPIFVGMTLYDETLNNVLTAFNPVQIKNTLGSYLSSCKKTQARVAETEKYAHVTFFFNGGEERANEGESRFLVQSPNVPTYDLMPQMSGQEVAQKAAAAIGEFDVLIMNFANCDMVGHTGNFDATVKAVESVDKNLKIVVDAVIKSGGIALVLADHGNAEMMSYEDGTPLTAHTTSPVPLILVSEKHKDCKLENGKLCDVAPTFLSLIGLDIPKEMTGKNLLK